MRDILIYFDYKYNGNWDEIYSAICRKEKVELEEVRRIAEELSKKYTMISLIDDDYPEELKTQYKPPFVIKLEKSIEV